MLGAVFSAQVTIDRKVLIAAGHPPFMVVPAVETLVDRSGWIVAGRDGGNCLAFPDGVRAVFEVDDPAIVLCQELNARAAR